MKAVFKSIKKNRRLISDFFFYLESKLNLIRLLKTIFETLAA